MIPPHHRPGPVRGRSLVAAGLVLSALAACSSPPRQAQTPPGQSAPGGESSPTAETAPPPPYRLQFGEGGGFTGLWGGYTVEPDGVVLQWRGRGPGDAESDTLGVLSAEGRRLIWDELEAAGFFAATSDERGNMSRFIRVEAAADTHQLFWNYVPVVDTLATGRSWTICEAAVMAAEPIPGR